VSQQPFCRENLEGLTQWRAGNFQNVTQSHFINKTSWQQGARKNLFPQSSGNILV
jgi:hypothetical protein